MKCAKCGTEIQGSSRFCPNCGSRIQNVCPTCGHEISEGMKFCSSCGKELDNAIPKENMSTNASTRVNTINKQNSGVNRQASMSNVTACECKNESLFMHEIEWLCNSDQETKAVIGWIGKDYLKKWFLPFLKQGEQVVSLWHIQNSPLFSGRLHREFVALTSERVICFEKHQYMKSKIRYCSLGAIQTIDAETKKNNAHGILIGERLNVVCNNGKISMRTVGAGKALQLKQAIEQLTMQRDSLGDMPVLPYTEITIEKGKRSKVDIVLIILSVLLLFFLGVHLLAPSKSNTTVAPQITSSEEMTTTAQEEMSEVETNVNQNSTETQTVKEENAYLLPDVATRYLTEADLAHLSKEQLRLARNEVFARHGRKFETEDLNAYFSAQSWYNGTLTAEQFDDSVLNEYEKANLDLIKQVENGGSVSSSFESINLCGVYSLNLAGGGAELEIQYFSDDDVYYAVFNGSQFDSAGFTEGILDAYTDGSDGVWNYYDYELYSAGNYNPSMRLSFSSTGVRVESLDGDAFGGMEFGGFSGQYDKTQEYPMP